MSWIMKRLHLIFIALVLCGATNGFTVWNRTPVVDWQAGHSNTLWNQNDQLSTPVQPSKLLAERGANVKGGRFGSVQRNSEVQTAQHDPSFVQSSGASAGDVSILYAQSQGGPTVQQQDTLASGPSRIYRFESLDPVNKGSLVTQSQSAANTNLVFGSHTQLSSGPSMANPVTAGQFAVAQSLGTSYPKPTSGRYPIFHGQMSTAPPQVSGFQTQSWSQPSTTTHVSEGQSVSSSRAQTPGASTMYGGVTSGMRQTIPSSSQSAVPTGQLSGFQATAYQPSTVTSVLAGQPVVAHAQSLGDSYPIQISGRYVNFQGLSSPSSSQVPVFQAQSSYQPSTATQVLTGQSASTSMAQSSGASTLNQGLTSGRYLTALSPNIPSAYQSAVPTGQMSEFQTSYQPIYTTQVLTGPSTSTPLLQSSDASTVYELQPSSGYNPPHQSVPSSMQSVSTNQMYGSPAQSAYQPSTPLQISTGQSLSSSPLSQAPFSSRAESSENAKWYTIMHPQTISASFPSVGTSNWLSGFQTQSSNQPSSVSQILAGQSTIAESLQASDSYASQTSGSSTILQGQPSPSQLSGFQTQSSHQPSSVAWFSAGLPASTAQAQSSGASMLNQDFPSGRYLTSLAQSSPSAVQPAATLNLAYGTHSSSYQPMASLLPGQFDSIAAAQSMGGSQKVLPRSNIK